MIRLILSLVSQLGNKGLSLSLGREEVEEVQESEAWGGQPSTGEGRWAGEVLEEPLAPW